MILIGVDPGKTTGVFLYDPEIGIRFHDEISSETFREFMGLQERRQYRKTLFVVEDFVITQQTGKKTQQPDALKNIGIIEYVTNRVEGLDYVTQTPSQKDWSTDFKLKAAGWYSENKRHANDAARHVLRYAWFNRLLDDSTRGKIVDALRSQS